MPRVLLLARRQRLLVRAQRVPAADVAAELGITPGTLRSRIHYGLRRLRCVLETEATA
jgi:DNA-directed RNA polymerase specialized sigma24 family protein